MRATEFMKAVLPESMAQLGAQCLLSNAFHLYERPGEDVLDEAGGLAKFMNWDGPTFTDSGGFQVFSLSSLRKACCEGQIRLRLFRLA